ncbi:MAG: hypothetical protein RJA59_1844 [Pseudomonadota bacterium]|jgi:hypothetical protein
MSRIRSLTREDRHQLGDSIPIDEMLPGEPPPEPVVDDLPPEVEFAPVEPAAAPPPEPEPPVDLDALAARLANRRARYLELLDERESCEQRASDAAEAVRAAVQESKRARYDLLVEPSPEKELRANEARERARVAYENESAILEARSLFEPALAAVDQEVQQLARQIDAVKVARLKAKLEARQPERSAILLREMAECLLLHEVSGGWPIEPQNFGPLLIQSIGFDKSITEAARLLRVAEGLS